MGMPAAKHGDQVIATDIHIVLIQAPPSPPIPVPVPHSFTGIIDGNLSQNVLIEGMPAATVDSTATNQPSHIPQGGPFQKSPSNKATINMGSATVNINGKKAARNGDTAITCNDPSDMPIGKVIAAGIVLVG
ncbi:MAG TPA: PAAR domain-containing protein [Candidatus Nanoarchaeia archaeon]|nr:PAAR domain-containing protein [Candidatus Nanoarchaeia archaeon]